MRNGRFRAVDLGCLLASLLVVSPALAATYTVDEGGNGADTNIGDGICGTGSGCSLRAAIQESNASSSVDDTIDFSFAGTISLTSDLPVVTDTVTLNGGSGAPTVVINGGAVSSSAPVIDVDGAFASIIKNIAVIGGKHDCVRFRNVSSGTIRSSRLGADLTGFPIGCRSAVVVESATGIQIGGDSSLGLGNTMSKHSIAGVRIEGNSNAIIQGNDIGLDPARSMGTGVLASAGVLVNSGTPTVTIGGGSATLGNVITGNAYAGIQVSASSNVTIQNNIIGLNASGTAIITPGPRQVNGIYVNLPAGQNANVTIRDNVISGNKGVAATDGHGIAVYGSAPPTLVITGNKIGSSASGNVAVSNTGAGIFFAGSSVIPFGPIPLTLTGNIISGNAADGVRVISLSGNPRPALQGVIKGNRIGIAADGTPMPNTENGMQLVSGGTGLVIGGSGAAEPNLIGYNGFAGLYLVPGSTGLDVRENSFISNAGLGIDVDNINGTQLGRTLNDNNGPNGVADFACLDHVAIRSGGAIVSGFAPVSGGQIDFYLAGNGAGAEEGIDYIGTFREGSSDSDGSTASYTSGSQPSCGAGTDQRRFSFVLPGVSSTNIVSIARHTSPAQITSEFSGPPSGTCTDGNRNGNETDVDCGGDCGPTCDDGEMCEDDDDCLNMVCMGGVCVAPSCTDGVKNGHETDIDCGGDTCDKCDDGEMCTMDSDCLSDDCKNGFCQGNQESGLSGGAVGANCSATHPARSSSRGIVFGFVLMLLLLFARRRVRMAPFFFLVALLASAGFSSQAQAQFDLNQFRPSERAKDGFAISTANDLGHLRFSVQLYTDYARNPLVFERRTGASSSEAAQVVKHQLTGHLLLSFGLWRRVIVFAGLPYHFIIKEDKNDDLSVLSNSNAAVPTGSGLGDLWTGVRIRLFGERQDLFQLAVQGTLNIHTAALADSNQAYSGGTDKSPRIGGHPELFATFNFFNQRLHISPNVGYRMVAKNNQFVFEDKVANTLNPIAVADQLTYGVGGIFEVLRGKHGLDAILELYGRTGLGVRGSQGFANREETPLELIGGLKYHHHRGISSGVGGGGGMMRGLGSPDWRVFAMLAYTTPGDEDEAVSNLDSDCDGILDVNDQCPNDAEDKDGFEDADGCPERDNDQDGVLDGDDQCPNVAGPEKTKGCPVTDRDADGVVDRIDNCPDESGDKKNFGCIEQQLVEIKDDHMEILERVYFHYDSARIQKRSYRLLDNVAAVLNVHPEIGKIQVEGHTDARASDDYNLRLSQARAGSVVTYLLSRGVEPARLAPRGFGETRLVVPNAKTEKEHARNRRVEFNIIDKNDHVKDTVDP